jgi:hypothetical protein
MSANPYYYCQFPKLAYACASSLPPLNYPLIIPPPVTQPTFTYIPNAPSPTPISFDDNIPDDECHSAAYQFLVGSTYNVDALAFIKGGVSVLGFDKLPASTIILKPGTMTTAIFIANRLRIHYDNGNDNVVTQVNCG